MIKVIGSNGKELTFDGDSFSVEFGNLTIQNGGRAVACYAPGYWASVEKETQPILQSVEAEAA